MKLSGLPIEILILVYLHLIDETDWLMTSVRSLAATCQRCRSILDETRLIWIHMFGASFDLLEHHKVAEFDIKCELKHRVLALRRPNRVEPLPKIELLCMLVFENDGKNLKTLSASPGYFEILEWLCRYLVSVMDHPDAGNEPPQWEVFTTVESILSLDVLNTKQFFNHIDMFCLLNSPPPSLQYTEAQLNHVAMLDLLTWDSKQINLPIPCLSTTRHDLGTADNATRLQDAHVLPMFMSLTGKWCGYYGYCWRDVVDGAMQLVLSTSEMTGGVPGILRLQGEGTDPVGRFVIEGLVRDAGVVEFRKQYTGSHSWWYRGWMLPWGIAGRWNDGMFWIWKSVGELSQEFPSP